MYCEALFKLNEHRGYKLSIFKAYIMIIVVEPCVEINKIEKKKPINQHVKRHAMSFYKSGYEVFLYYFLTCYIVTHVFKVKNQFQITYQWTRIFISFIYCVVLYLKG